ncbi:MAG: hypothetical protein MZV70_14245 [Desulfobacterales bacterium]|nr:hypothetical protein [Desulfobacterales bacterium]
MPRARPAEFAGQTGRRNPPTALAGGPRDDDAAGALPAAGGQRIGGLPARLLGEIDAAALGALRPGIEPQPHPGRCAARAGWEET